MHTPGLIPDRQLCMVRIAVINKRIDNNKSAILIRAAHAFAFPIIGVGLFLLAAHFGGDAFSAVWRSVTGVLSTVLSSFFVKAPVKEILECRDEMSKLVSLKVLYEFAMKRREQLHPAEFTHYEELFWKGLKG